MDKKKTILILGMFGIIFMFFGGSLAYWTWTTSSDQQTNVVFTVTKDFECAADGGGNITSSDVELVPTDCTNSTYAIKREVTVTPTVYDTELSVYMDLWLDINSLGTGLSNSTNFSYALTTSESSCTEGVISTGNFNGKTTNDTVKILGKSYSASTIETYWLYIWLDSAETSSSTMNQTFDLSLNGSCTNDPYVPPEAPVLDSGMIPVTISNTGTVQTISEYSEDWYDYSNKEWANVVLVDSDSRNSYLGTTGKTVTSSDILAYYVWIPRYKYKLWTVDATKTTSPQTIDILFESRAAEVSEGTNVGDYMTHPAFIWDGETTAGIWVGKFETTGDATTPTILPNTQSLRSQKVSAQFMTSLNFSGGTLSNGVVTFTGNNTYGLTSITDSHMMKNSEWGAVAYLSHSKYGINSEIYINNSSGYYTGRSGGNVGGSVNTLATQFPDSETSTNQYNSYGYYTWTGQTIDASGNIGSYASDRTLGTNASTTGNVTGVYDMSGGAWEYVMGVFSDSNGNTRSGKSSSANSGFNGLLSDDTEYTSGISFPNSKYYDLYLQSQFTGDYSTNTPLCTLDTCGGHAVNETSGWYSDHAYFVDSGRPWFRRGGSWDDDIDAGAFVSGRNIGGAGSLYSWRSVLVVDGA